MVKRIIKKLVLLKTFGLRTLQYLGLVNTLFIFLTFKKTYDIQISSFWVLVFGFLFCMVFGYYDYHYIMPIEAKQINAKNDVKHDLIRVEKKIDELIKLNR